LADWRIRDTVLATVEVVSYSATAVPAVVWRAPKDARSTAAETRSWSDTYEHHSVLVRTG